MGLPDIVTEEERKLISCFMKIARENGDIPVMLKHIRKGGA